MENHTEIKSRQVSGKMGRGEGEVPAIEKSGSCKATMYGEVARGDKFDENGPDCCNEGPMPEEHTSRIR